MGLNNFPQQAAQRTGTKRCLMPTGGNAHEIRLASGTRKPLPGELPSPSVTAAC